MNGYNLKEMEQILNKAHPMQIINKVKDLHICLFKTTIEYVTSRKNKRKRELYFVINTYNPQYNLTKEVQAWQEDYNKNKDSHKQISNAIILESLCEGFLHI
jgi:hypothetical protein